MGMFVRLVGRSRCGLERGVMTNRPTLDYSTIQYVLCLVCYSCYAVFIGYKDCTSTCIGYSVANVFGWTIQIRNRDL